MRHLAFMRWINANAAAIQAATAVASLIVAAVLAWVTWKYMRLTRDLLATARAQLDFIRTERSSAIDDAAGAQAGGGVMVINGATGSVTEIATPYGQYGFAALNGIVVNEETNKVYVTDFMSQSLLVIDGRTNELTVRALDYRPCSVVINASTNTVYVSHCSDGRISIIHE